MTQRKYVRSELPANMKDFLRINGELFLRGAKVLLMKYVSRQEGLTLMHRFHYDICGVNLDVSLYRRLQRLGIFWPEIANDAKEEQRSCKTCSVIPPDRVEVLNGKLLGEDWQDPYLKYLLQGILPADRVQKEKLKKYMTRFKVVDGKLFKRSFQGKWMVCIPTKEVNGVLLDLHEGELIRHLGGRNLWQISLRQGYYWPTMQKDAQDFAKKYLECQRRGDKIRTSHQSLHLTVTPYPFYSWGLDFIGPINPLPPPLKDVHGYW